MGTVAENLKHWSYYAWSRDGDEWSVAWGGTEYLWYGTILPRIRAFVPTGSILEIAPGYGRCTQYLKDLCQEITIVDLTEGCIEACKRRFASNTNIRYLVNDGKSLEMIEDSSIDFVFSWDSLVHAESDVLLSYLEYLAVKLKPGGWGFIHHSNIGSFKDAETGELTIENAHWRAESMRADLFEEFCQSHGLTCVSQELVGWGCTVLTDCFSLFTRDGADRPKPAKRVENPGFMEEAVNLKRISDLYRRDAGSSDEVVDRYERALFLKSNGRTEEAMRELEELLAADGSNAQAHNDIAVLHYELGDSEKALQHMQSSVALDPSNATAQKNLADLHLELGRPQEALRTWRTVLAQNPRDTDALLSLGNICRNMGQTEQAGRLFARVLEIDPGKVTAKEDLAAISAILSQKTSAQMVPARKSVPRCLSIAVTNECNLRCKHCHLWMNKDPDNALTNQERMDLISEFHSLNPHGSVALCGGEPMKKTEEFFALAGRCRQLNLSCSANTNGTYIDSAEMAERLLLHGPNVLAVSLDSHSEEIHDYVRGVKGCFSTVLAGIKMLLETRRQEYADCDVRILTHCVIFDGNAHLLNEYIHFAKALGVDGVMFQMLAPTFANQGQDDRFFAEHFFREKREAQARIDELAEKFGSDPFVLTNAEDLRWMKLYIENPDFTIEPVCGSHERNLIVGLTGEVQLCYKMTELMNGEMLGNVPEHTLAELWFSPLADRARQIMEGCRRNCGMLNCHKRA
jgi:MoaA/NifB/PqqE/SkfB family radical SAM enzyme/SAM-dependent methyltransferase